MKSNFQIESIETLGGLLEVEMVDAEKKTKSGIILDSPIDNSPIQMAYVKETNKHSELAGKYILFYNNRRIDVEVADSKFVLVDMSNILAVVNLKME